MKRGAARRLVMAVVVIVLIGVRLSSSRRPAAPGDAPRPDPRAESARDPAPPGQTPGAAVPPVIPGAGRDSSDSVCPVEGEAKSPRLQALNVLKNRTTVPSPAELDTTITLGALVAPGDDRRRFSARTAVRVSGYVADVKVGGVETVNCKAKDPDARDTHIELTLEPMNEDESKHVIVEVTPRWRTIVAARGEDWSTRALRRDLKGRWVEVTGWLLYDEEHEANAANTQRGKAKVWRATAWEVHPITALRVLERPPGR